MKTLEKVSDFVGKYMAAIVIVVAALALLFPGTFSVVKTAWVNTLLGIVMFGMGLTLKPEDFRVRPMPNITMPSRLLTHAVFTTLNGPGKNRAPAATTITMAAMYLPTKSLTFSSVFIIVSPFPSDMLWDKSIRKTKRPCPLRSVRDKGV